MSTRANYRIDDTLFYIHHDGYPEGAAGYFNDAIIKNKGALTAEAFMRANERCEFSDGLHGDIEYFYNYNSKEGVLRAYSVDFEGEKTLFFNGSIYEFINEYIKTDWIDDETVINIINESCLPWATSSSIGKRPATPEEIEMHKNGTSIYNIKKRGV